MPTYEYECSRCGFVFEDRHSITEDPSRKCPECHGDAFQRISGGSGFIIRGNAPAGAKTGGCSLEVTGKTCCGKEERCDKPPCGR